MTGAREQTWATVHRNGAGVRNLLAVAAEHAMPADDCLHGTRIRLQDVHGEDAEVDAHSEIAVTRNVLRRLGDPVGLGVEVGLRTSLGNLGVVGFVMLASSTARAAIEVSIPYAQLSGAFVECSLVEDGDRASLVFDASEIPSDVRQFFLVRDLTLIALLAPMILGQSPDFSAELELGADAATLVGRVFSGADIRYGCPTSRLSFDRAVLELPLPQADAATSRLFQHECERLLGRRHPRRGITEEVRARMMGDIQSNAGMAEIAAQLFVDPRTLRRRLSREGTSFRALRDEVRETMADELLSTVGLTVEQTAHLLGYSTSGSFSRAHTRWRGVPPSSMRRPPASWPHTPQSHTP